MTRNDKAARQWEYEQGDRRLPEAPRSIGNWSLAGVIWRLARRRRDRLDSAAGRMQAETWPEPGQPSATRPQLAQPPWSSR